jgi:tetratricopeptide (TPR) repeat protein
LIPVNRKLGKFEIVRKLARGGMADVYLVLDEAGRHIALKVIEHAADPDTCESIEAERRGSALQERLAAIDPRVVRIYETGDTDGHFYVAMEYIEGEDLAEVIGRGPIPPPRAVEIALEICDTLEHAHHLQAAIDGKLYQGIIHGDIKPRNIRIDPQGRVRVLDFGIAKALSLSRRLTHNEFGSIQYVSPERLDTGDVDRMSDLWSVAVVLYEMVTSMQPYQAATTERLERMIRSRIPPPPAPEPCPEPLRRILIKAMAPDPAWRYQLAEDFAADLRTFQSGGEVTAEADQDQETRRTFHAEPADDSTRRTVKPSPSGRPAAVPGVRPAAARRPLRRYIGRAFGILLVAGAIYAGYWFASTWFLLKHGQELETAIQTEALTDPDKIWERWTELAGGRSSSLVLYGARRGVKQKLVAAAENVIGTYRNSDTQPVYQKDWERAHAYLAKALTVDPGDDSIRGRLRLCEGHIDRIAGSSRRNPNVGLLEQAAQKFHEAQQLIPKLPDPQLGLARLYAYGLKDPDKADAALREAERHGYELGNRDKALLADSYLDRGDRLFYDSRNVRGLPQEKDEVQKAAGDYHRALELYQQIAPYSNSIARIARVQSSLESVDFRLQQLKEGGTAWP